jgi:type II secretory pathway pseudopilin PulG
MQKKIENPDAVHQYLKGFTIIELLTVMSIIIILLGVLVPALNRVRRYAKDVVQRGQFHEISKGLELFRNDHSENYPDSGAVDSSAPPVGYCGAMKLCEALVGQDGMGFNPKSRFSADGAEPNGASFYLFDLCQQISPPYTPDQTTNLQDRIKYVDSENVKAVRLRNLFDASWAFETPTNYYIPKEPFDETLKNAVITDVFLRPTIKGGTFPIGCNERAGQKTGMPVLYYKADTSKLNHDSNDLFTFPTNPNIYNFDDNYALTLLGCPWENSYITHHPMADDPGLFIKEITNTQVTATPRPHREDGYILMSAGFDGLYGTRDDVFNFSE